jgi:serine/threonine-protein kinase
MSTASGRKIGSFVVERVLGQGGMGVVYLARQPALDRRVVLKTLRRDLADEPSLEERFQREAQAAAGVHHQNVVAVYDCFTFRGETFIAQEYVEGMDLASVLQAAQRLSPRVGALIALEMARGLEEIHARGVVHRDLKPANILLGREGETKIADFGIALDGKGKALTQVGVALGTPQYMSLEQLLGERPDYRSDLFSLGVVLYQMLTGETPFAERESSKDGPSLARRIQAGRFPSPRRRSPTTPRTTARLIRSCLRAKARKRIASATAVRRVLERHLGAPSPADCRSEIAAFLWERKIFQASSGKTALGKRARMAPRRKRDGGGWRWAVALASCAAAGAAAVATGRVDLQALPLPAAFATGEVAVVRFETPPRTEIRIDDGEPVAPSAPVELAPGKHRITFTHPRFGRSERTLDLESGEERVVQNVFQSPKSPPHR